MNKKSKVISIVLLSLLVVGLVSAGIVQYYGEKQTTLNVKLPIKVTGTTKESIGGIGCEQVTGGDITIENLADQEIDIKITPEIVEGEGVETSYIGTLVLTKKTISDWKPTGTSIEINYTIVGETFEVTGIPEGYTLIYYKDNEANVDDAERLLVLGKSAVLSKNMPHANDWNAGEYADYCNNEIDGYTTCKGAKLWAVPNDNIVDGILVWSSPEEFYFETNLIQYNKEGIITMYPLSNLVINPVFDLDCMLEGTVVINTTIDNV